jgi:hypothetical protein
VVIVGNGVEPDYVPAGARAVALPVNQGIPEGRNVGAEALAGPDRGESVTAIAKHLDVGRFTLYRALEADDSPDKQAGR